MTQPQRRSAAAVIERWAKSLTFRSESIPLNAVGGDRLPESSRLLDIASRSELRGTINLTFRI